MQRFSVFDFLLPILEKSNNKKENQYPEIAIKNKPTIVCNDRTCLFRGYSESWLSAEKRVFLKRKTSVTIFAVLPSESDYFVLNRDARLRNDLHGNTAFPVTTKHGRLLSKISNDNEFRRARCHNLLLRLTSTTALDQVKLLVTFIGAINSEIERRCEIQARTVKCGLLKQPL